MGQCLRPGEPNIQWVSGRMDIRYEVLRHAVGLDRPRSHSPGAANSALSVKQISLVGDLGPSASTFRRTHGLQSTQLASPRIPSTSAYLFSDTRELQNRSTRVNNSIVKLSELENCARATNVLWVCNWYCHGLGVARHLLNITYDKLQTTEHEESPRTAHRRPRQAMLNIMRSTNGPILA